MWDDRALGLTDNTKAVVDKFGGAHREGPTPAYTPMERFMSVPHPVESWNNKVRGGAGPSVWFCT